MSNAITTICRPLRMSPAQKAVLMCLADFAHDDGTDWHSKAAIAEWTCLSKRAVIDAVAWLEANGYLKIDRRTGANNRTLLQLNHIEAETKQCSRRTSANPAPVQQAHQCTGRTSADAAVDQCSSRTTTSADAALTGADAAPEAFKASLKHEKQGVAAAPADMFEDDSATSAAASPKSKASASKRTTTGKKPGIDANTEGTRTAYVEAFRSRYGTEPVLAAKQNAQLRKLVETVGATDSPAVARFYLADASQYYIRRCHDVSVLLNDAHALCTRMRSGQNGAGKPGTRHSGFSRMNYHEGVEADGTFV